MQDPSTVLTFEKGTQERRLKFKDDVVAWTKRVQDTASIADSEMIFVGYGVVAPEFQWDDYKGVDTKGKTRTSVGARCNLREVGGVRTGFGGGRCSARSTGSRACPR